MKRVQPWMMWGGLAIGLWCLWGWAVFLPLERRHSRETARVAAMEQEKSAAMARLAAAPFVVAQNDSLREVVREKTEDLPVADALPQFLDGLAQAGYGHGLAQVSAAPSLASVMKIPAVGKTRADDVRLDTLQVDLVTTGEFTAIGNWLESIEGQAGFQRWMTCQWLKGETPGTVSFTGEAAFWIVVPSGQGQ